MFDAWKRAATLLPAAAMTLHFALPAHAQEANPTTVAPGARSADVIAQSENGTYVYHVKVVQRDLDAVNYLNRSSAAEPGRAGVGRGQSFARRHLAVSKLWHDRDCRAILGGFHPL